MSLTQEPMTKDSHAATAARSVDRGFTAAFELVATPAAFGFLGYLVDRWLGTGPIFTIALAGFVACYVVWKLWYQYNAEMDRLDAERRAPVETSAVETSVDEASVDEACADVASVDKPVNEAAARPTEAR